MSQSKSSSGLNLGLSLNPGNNLCHSLSLGLILGLCVGFKLTFKHMFSIYPTIYTLYITKHSILVNFRTNSGQQVKKSQYKSKAKSRPWSNFKSKCDRLTEEAPYLTGE